MRGAVDKVDSEVVEVQPARTFLAPTKGIVDLVWDCWFVCGIGIPLVLEDGKLFLHDVS